MLEGEISEINLIERLVELWREQFTGAIRFENDGIIKIVYFKTGDVLSASTNDRADSIDEILMRAGKVSREHVKQALAKRKENETLGDALLNLGFITRKELTWARRVQVVGVIRSIAAWTVGSFTIVADYLPKRDEGTLFPLPQVLVELIVTDQDRLKVERALEGGSAVYAKAADFDGVFRRLGLNEDADAIVAEVDGVNSAAEVATASGKDAFNVYKLLYALATLRILTPASIPQASPELSLSDFGGAGIADAADMWSEPPTSTLPNLELDITSPGNSPVPSYSLPYEEPVAAPPSSSAWDEPEDDAFSFDTEEPAPTVVSPMPAAPGGAMPSWDEPVRPVPPPPIVRPAVAPEPAASEEQWGFDEAQLETAQRAASPAVPIPPPAPSVLASATAHRRRPARSQKRYGLIITLLVLAILGAAGYYGFLWWQDRASADAALQASNAAPVAKPAPPVVTPSPVDASSTGTIVEVATPNVTDTAATSTTGSVSSTQPVATASVPPVTATSAQVVPPAGAATPVSTQALPPVIRKTDSGKAQYDAMAREFAANASGNFTVQIQILCESSNLDKAMREGGSDVWFVPQTIGARSCYRVFWGRYPTREAAQQALSRVPASLRDRNSAVKPVPRPQ
jgi:hypothetical protein